MALAIVPVEENELVPSKEVTGDLIGDFGLTGRFCSFRVPSLVGDLVGDRGETCAEFLLTPGLRYLSGFVRSVRGGGFPLLIIVPARSN